MTAPAPPSTLDTERGTHDRRLQDEWVNGLAVPAPRTGITDDERGLQTATPETAATLSDVSTELLSAPPRPHTLAQAANRLADVYGAAGARTWVPLTRTALPGLADTAFFIVLGDVYSTDGNLGPRARSYKADLDVFVPALETASLDWALTTLGQHLDELTDLEAQLTSLPALAPLMQAANDYTETLARSPTNYVRVDLPQHQRPIDLPPGAEIIVEDPETRQANEARAEAGVDNPNLSILLRHPLRHTIVVQLAAADGPEAGAAILRRVFSDARQGINSFADALSAQPDHVWRYAPIVVGGLARLGLDANEPLVRYAVDLARLKSGSEWDTALLVAGVAVAAAGLVVSGPAGWAILVADLAVGGLSAYGEYARASENDSAEAASAFRAGAPFTDRHVSYGRAALAGAAALITAGLLARGVFRLVRATPPLAPGPAAPPAPVRKTPWTPSRPARPCRGPHCDRGLRPPDDPIRQRKAVGETERGGPREMITPQQRGLGPDARRVGKDPSGLEPLDIRAAKSKDGGKGAAETPEGRPRRADDPTGAGAGVASTGSRPAVHVLYRGTTRSRKQGEYRYGRDDFGPGTYFTDERAVAVEGFTTGTRVKDEPGVVLRAEVTEQMLGRILDLTRPPHRDPWNALVAQITRGRVRNEQYLRTLEAYLGDLGKSLDDFDTVIGPNYLQPSRARAVEGEVVWSTQYNIRNPAVLHRVLDVAEEIALPPPAGSGD